MELGRHLHFGKDGYWGRRSQKCPGNRTGHSWAQFSLQGRSRLQSGDRSVPRGTGSGTGRQGHSSQGYRAEGSSGAADPKGKNIPHSWDHTSYCCRSCRACHTVAPTFLGHIHWNSHRPASLAHIGTDWVPHNGHGHTPGHRAGHRTPCSHRSHGSTAGAGGGPSSPPDGTRSGIQPWAAGKYGGPPRAARRALRGAG